MGRHRGGRLCGRASDSPGAVCGQGIIGQGRPDVSGWPCPRRGIKLFSTQRITWGTYLMAYADYSKLKVLIVDDFDNFRMAVSKMLQEYGAGMWIPSVTGARLCSCAARIVTTLFCAITIWAPEKTASRCWRNCVIGVCWLRNACLCWYRLNPVKMWSWRRTTLNRMITWPNRSPPVHCVSAWIDS